MTPFDRLQPTRLPPLRSRARSSLQSVDWFVCLLLLASLVIRYLCTVSWVQLSVPRSVLCGGLQPQERLLLPPSVYRMCQGRTCRSVRHFRQHHQVLPVQLITRSTKRARLAAGTLAIVEPSAALGMLSRALMCSLVSRSSVACEAAATAQLATYAFPPQAPPVFHWFESCVEEIVKNLDKAPFLQLVFPDRKHSFERHQVNASRMPDGICREL